MSEARYLKWQDHVIATIDAAGAVSFGMPEYNEVVKLYTHGKQTWTPEEFATFLAERVVSRDRRDIEKILFRCGLSQYDVMGISRVTRGMHPKDLLWIANDPNESFDDVMTDVFDSVFVQGIDLVGDSLDTPEGANIKRYGVFEGHYGIFKKRINPLTTDVESEVACYLLAQRLGVPCCPAVQVDADTVFSTFLYDFSHEFIVHYRRFFEGPRGENEYRNLVDVRPEFADDVARMVLFDFITRQDDRHLSNVAVKVTEAGERFYPLYDNGRSLFYEDTPEMVEVAVADIPVYATTFGAVGTYWDYAQEIAAERKDFAGLLHLDITSEEIEHILQQAGFEGYRLQGATRWIAGAMELLRGLAS